MRPMPDQRLEHMRQIAFELEHYGFCAAGTGTGVFAVRRKGQVIRMIASEADIPEAKGWEHVSVSLANRCPTWDEMCFVKDLFWSPAEAVMQLHPPQSEYVNNHPYCLHLWRHATIPLPPSIMVGVASIGVVKTARDAERVLREAGAWLPPAPKDDGDAA